MERGRIQGLSKFFEYPLLSQERVKLRTSNLTYIYWACPNKSPLNFFQKTERGRIQGLPKFFGYPLLSEQRVKLRTSTSIGTFIGSTGTKAYENIGNSGRGRSQGVPKIFRAPICRAHCAVIFAIAQLSCIKWIWLPVNVRVAVVSCLSPDVSAPSYLLSSYITRVTFISCLWNIKIFVLSDSRLLWMYCKFEWRWWWWWMYVCV